MGEHIALGPPFLSEDCLIDLPGGTLSNHPEAHHPNNRLKAGASGPWSWTETKDGSRVDLSRVPQKSVRSYDMPDGWYAVTNQRTGVGCGFLFPKDVFWWLWYWHSFGGGFGYPWCGRTYNLGLEPFTSYGTQSLAGAMENGTALKLPPGERVVATQKAIAYEGTQGVERINPDGSVVKKG